MRPDETVQEAGKLTGRFSVDTIIPGIITLVFCGIVIYIIRAFLIKSLHHNDKLDDHQKERFVKTVTTILSIIAVLIVVSGYGLQSSSLVAIMGVAGLALSLSVQGLLTNFFSGCVLPLTKPFREGDYIEVNGNIGFIEHIGYFNTTLVNLENITIVIPNSYLTNSFITNYSAKKVLQVEHTFNIGVSVKDEDIRTAIRGAIGKDSRILPEPEPFIHLESFDAMSATYVVRVPCKNSDYFGVYYTLVENMRASFDEHSIEMGAAMFGMGMGGAGQQSGGGRSGAGGGSGTRGGTRGGGAGGGRGGAGGSGSAGAGGAGGRGSAGGGTGTGGAGSGA